MANLKDYWRHPLYRVCRMIVWIALHAMFRIRVVGRDWIPRSGPVILASNHIHNLDPPLLGLAVPRYVRFMAKSELFRYKLIGDFLGIIGGFPVHRGASDKAAIRNAIAVTEQGGCLLVFPEGHRSKTGKLGPSHPGVAFIARKAGCPITPVAIIGSYRLFRKLAVHFGPPIEVLPEDTNESLIRRVMEGIERLLKEGGAI